MESEDILDVFDLLIQNEIFFEDEDGVDITDLTRFERAFKELAAHLNGFRTDGKINYNEGVGVNKMHNWHKPLITFMLLLGFSPASIRGMLRQWLDEVSREQKMLVNNAARELGVRPIFLSLNNEAIDSENILNENVLLQYLFNAKREALSKVPADDLFIAIISLAASPDVLNNEPWVQKMDEMIEANEANELVETFKFFSDAYMEEETEKPDGWPGALLSLLHIMRMKPTEIRRVMRENFSGTSNESKWSMNNAAEMLGIHPLPFDKEDFEDGVIVD